MTPKHQTMERQSKIRDSRDQQPMQENEEVNNKQDASTKGK